MYKAEKKQRLNRFVKTQSDEFLPIADGRAQDHHSILNEEICKSNSTRSETIDPYANRQSVEMSKHDTIRFRKKMRIALKGTTCPND